MSSNDNITIKFSGNDFFYVSARDMPTDGSCNDTYVNGDFGDCNVESNSLTPTVLWRAFELGDDKIQPGNYATFMDDKFVIMNKNVEILKEWSFNIDGNIIEYRVKDKFTMVINNKNVVIEEPKGGIFTTNNKFYFNTYTTPSTIHIIDGIDIPKNFSTIKDFSSEIELLNKKRKQITSFYAYGMTRIDSNIQNSLFTSDKKFKLTMDSTGNLVLLYYSNTNDTAITTASNCYKKELCKNKEKSKEIYNLQHNHLGTDQNYLNSKSMYSLELRRTFSLSIGILILFGTIYYTKK